MRPVNLSQMTEAVRLNLRAHPLLQNVLVERANEIVDDPGRCPWVGIYKAGFEITPRAVGGALNQSVELILIARESDGTSGAECEDRLESLVTSVIQALYDDQTFRGTALKLDNVAVRYDEYRLENDQYLQQATISVRILCLVV